MEETEVERGKGIPGMEDPSSGRGIAPLGPADMAQSWLLTGYVWEGPEREANPGHKALNKVMLKSLEFVISRGQQGTFENVY
jgi:hypothetical protein